MRPPLDAYDVLIHLNPKQVPLLRHAVDAPVVTFSRGVMTNGADQAGGAFPVVDYNPVSLYLTELRVSSNLPCRHIYSLLTLMFSQRYYGISPNKIVQLLQSHHEPLACFNYQYCCFRAYRF